LSGLAGLISVKEEKIAKSLLVFSSLRGVDSTGIVGISELETDGCRNIKIAKEVGNVYNLMDLKSFDKVFTQRNCVLIGHNRSATVGAINKRNAHPFVLEDIVGAHNGSLEYGSKNRLQGSAHFGTDSEAIINSIQTKGIEHTIEELDKNDAYALTWYDNRDHTINLIRNDKRTLFYCYINSGQTLVWASEAEFLYAILSREAVSISPPPGEEDKERAKMFLLTPDTLLTFKLPKSFSEKLQPPEKKQIEPKKHSWTNYSSVFPNNRHGTNTYTLSYIPSSSSTSFPTKTENNDGAKIIADAKNSLMVTKTTMSAQDIHKKREYERWEKNNEVPSGSRFREMFKGPSLKVYLDTQNPKNWISIRWNDVKQEWRKYESNYPPIDMPYPLYNIESSHLFLHQGKKKNKRIYYKGWQGATLRQTVFEDYMLDGCMGCQGVPVWGNKVMFLNKEGKFLCEFCSMDHEKVIEARAKIETESSINQNNLKVS
jgi:hypothetical protein